MTDRLLCVETPPLILEENSGKWRQFDNKGNDWTPLLTAVYDFQFWKHESKLDLSGYAMQDLTMYFRRSFEQRGGNDNINYTIAARVGVAQPSTIDLFDVAYSEVMIISSVPFTDKQLASVSVGLPGFIQSNYYSSLSGVDFGNFNRTHIIHGHAMTYSPDSVFGSGLTENATASPISSGAYTQPVNDIYFSSLEATAADCLYCYRLVFAPAARASPESTGLKQISLPPSRVLLDSMSADEADLEYLMRLKRSYELANQV